MSRAADPRAAPDLAATFPQGDWRLRVLAGQWRGLGVGMLLRAGLRVASWGARWYVARKNHAFDSGRRHATKLDVPVISIGNITTGGTGKTPMVAWLVNQLIARGEKPAIISRGYRADTTGENEEAKLLAAACPGVPHVQHPDRIAGGRQALANGDVTVLVLDDGFSHRRLARDVEIVLIDATAPFGFGHVLPRGLLREPLSSLRRADVVVITRSDLVDAASLDRVTSTIRANVTAETMVLDAAHTPRDLLTLPTYRHVVRFTEDSREGHATETMGPERVDVAWLRDRHVVAVAGIGNPAAFVRMLERAGARVTPMVFADHYHYAVDDVARIAALVRRVGADGVVTTTKDAVKLLTWWEGNAGEVPWWVLRVALTFESGCELTEHVIQLMS